MSDGQKFIGRNRAPRVQIEYELETNGAKKLVELPFIVGVMSDLAGVSKSAEATKALAERKFLEIDIDNFDQRMAALKPRVKFDVENVLTGEGTFNVDVEFSSMNDFSPIKVAEKVDALKQLVEARNQLAALLVLMDGKTPAETLLNRILDDTTLLKSIAAAATPAQKAAPDGEPT